MTERAETSWSTDQALPSDHRSRPTVLGAMATSALGDSLTVARARTRAEDRLASPPEAGLGRRVMVVQHDAETRDRLAELLSPRFAVQLIGDGREAWQWVRADRPSLIISDVAMPGMDGFALVRALRGDRSIEDLPIILISGLTDPDGAACALEAGADDYIVRPFGGRELLARVQATLQNARIRTDAGEVKGRVAALEARDRELRMLLGDLRAAQRRVTVSADQERRRIERDLHDGAQQRLISIRLELGTLAETLAGGSPVAAKLTELRRELGEALEELRDLSHGLYPSLLASDGLHLALVALARRAPLPVSVDATGLTRAPGSIESAAYFSCQEAINNAAKHAGDGVRVAVELSQRNGFLQFCVRDDGIGFDPGHRRRRGHGLLNISDRVEALGGTVHVSSGPACGTEVWGRIPLP